MLSLFNPQTVVLITASSNGLGAATARAFASHGARVVINYFSNAEKAEKLVEELSTLQPTPSSAPNTPRHIAIRADVSQKPQIHNLVQSTIDRMGRLDVVVSNHGWTKVRDFYNLDENVEEGDWDGCWLMNVKSHLWLFHAVKPYLEAKKEEGDGDGDGDGKGGVGGAFISTASLAGVVPSGSSIAYSTTKAAQIHLMKALAMISSSIRVNSVSPGILLTDWGLQFPQEKLDKAMNKSPLNRLALIEDVAEQIVCLAKSRSVTGTNTVIDAGWRLG